MVNMVCKAIYQAIYQAEDDSGIHSGSHVKRDTSFNLKLHVLEKVGTVSCPVFKLLTVSESSM